MSGNAATMSSFPQAAFNWGHAMRSFQMNPEQVRQMTQQQPIQIIGAGHSQVPRIMVQPQIAVQLHPQQQQQHQQQQSQQQQQQQQQLQAQQQQQQPAHQATHRTLNLGGQQLQQIQSLGLQAIPQQQLQQQQQQLQLQQQRHQQQQQITIHQQQQIPQQQQQQAAGQKQASTSGQGFTTEVRDYLEEQFKVNPSATVERRQELSASTGLTPNQIKYWFGDRRKKEFKRTGIRPASAPNGIRKRFPPQQRMILEAEFNRDCHLEPDRTKNIALITGLTPVQVRTWFRDNKKKLLGSGLSLPPGGGLGTSSDATTTGTQSSTSSSSSATNNNNNTSANNNNNTSNGGIRKKFPPQQRMILEAEFNRDTQLESWRTKNIATMTGLTPVQIRTWFRDNRKKLNKQNKRNNIIT